MVHSVKVSNQGAVSFLNVLYHSALETKVMCLPVNTSCSMQVQGQGGWFSTQYTCLSSMQLPVVEFEFVCWFHTYPLQVSQDTPISS